MSLKGNSFAAADPLRVIPSFVVGSAFTGALVGAFGIKLLAPHGGIFVVFLLSNPLLYLLFILIGAIISGIVYGLLKTCRSTCLKAIQPWLNRFLLFLFIA